VPQVVDGVKCVLVSEALKDIEPMAWDFVMNFARDNDLPVTRSVCCLHPSPTGQKHVGPAVRALVAAKPGVQAASASALTLADRRLFSRAALFLWKMRLSAPNR